MANKIVITEDKAQLIQELAGVESVNEITLDEFYKNMSVHASFDTGILPVQGSGLLSLRSALGYMQTAYIYEPGIWYLNWGASERDPNAKTYVCAQPYRVVISDYHKGKLLGSRTLYSTIPVISGDEQLYHVNVPNIVCQGYGDGNCLGWLCLYHRNGDYKKSFPEKLKNMLDRSSGIETYNDANMSSTDGPRFYQKKYKEKYPDNYNDYDFLWSPTSWEKKTKAEGFEWTLNDKLWIAIECDSLDEQWTHVDGGLPLTFNRALYGHYSAYYGDKESKSPKIKSKGNGSYVKPFKKPFNIITRKGEQLDKNIIFEALKASIIDKKHYTLFDNFDMFNFKVVKENVVDTFASPIQEKYECLSCKNDFAKYEFVKLSTKIVGDKLPEEVCVNCYTETVTKCKRCNSEALKTTLQDIESFGLICTNCVDSLGICSDCNKYLEKDLLHEAFGTVVCYDCQPVFNCPGCASPHKSLDNIISGEFCINCGVGKECDSCLGVHNLYDMNSYEKIKHFMFSEFNKEEIYLCDECNSHFMICSCMNLTIETNIQYDETTMSTSCTKCLPQENVQVMNFDDLINQA